MQEKSLQVIVDNGFNLNGTQTAFSSGYQRDKGSYQVALNAEVKKLTK